MPQRKALQRRKFPIRKPSRAAGMVVLPAMRRDCARRDAGAVPGRLAQRFGERGAEVVVRGASGDGGEDAVDGGVGFEAGEGGGAGVRVGGERGEGFAGAGGDDD